MKANLLRMTVFLGLALLCSGCIWSRQKINIEDFHNKAELVEPGTTKAKELGDILGGPPNAVLPLSEGRMVYVYTFGQGKTAGLNLVLFRVMKTNLGVDSAYFFIDQNKVVEEKVVSQNSKDIPWEWWAFGD